MSRKAARFMLLTLICSLLFAQPALGDSISQYKNQMEPGPARKAVYAAADAIEKGDLNAGEKFLFEAMTLKPDEPHALALLAEIEMRRGRPAYALKYLQDAVQKNPKSSVAEEAMGRYLAGQKDYAGAGAALQKSVQLDPKWIDARLSLGDFYLSQGKSADALASYRAAIEAEPQNGSAHLSLAMGLASSGDNRTAETEFRTAIGLMPGEARPHVALGNLLSLTGRDDSAVAEYGTAAKLEPHSSEPYTLIGMARDKEGRTDLAEQAYRKSIQLKPNDFVALNNLAWIEMKKPRQAGQAVVYAKRAVQAAPNVGQVVDTLAWAYYSNGEKELALQNLKRATALSPQDPKILYHFAVIYSDKGQTKEAREYLQKSLALNKDFPEIKDARARLAAMGGSAPVNH